MGGAGPPFQPEHDKTTLRPPSRRDVGRVPVVDERGRLVGLVTRKDLLRVHARQRAQENERQTMLGPGRTQTT